MNIPTLEDLLSKEQRNYLARRKSAKAFYKFWNDGAVKPINNKHDGHRPFGNYFVVDGVEYICTGVDLFNYRIDLKPIVAGKPLTKQF